MTQDSITATSVVDALDPGEFRVASAAEIAAILRALLETRTPVTLSADGIEPVTSQLCALDLARGTIAFDLPPGSSAASQMGQAREVHVEAFVDHIRVQFELDAPARANSVLRSVMPALVYRFQRRKAFRVKPYSRTPTAALRPLQGGAAPAKLRILDISTGGLALQLAAESVPWELGTQFHVLAELDRHTSFAGEMKLVGMRELKDETLSLGFEFTYLGPDAQRALHLYIDQTQKLSRLLRK